MTVINLIDLNQCSENYLNHHTDNKFSCRYIASTDNEIDEPVIKGLGVSDSNPLCVRKWFKKIVVEHPETRFELISN
ncbi:MAG TPA: hypothetical protein VEL11_10725 [Candidatus Bathyarchaeia archaeon]|nr:hypothetical protein [Candidatus Bathyarchaeia archaeon]